MAYQLSPDQFVFDMDSTVPVVSRKSHSTLPKPSQIPDWRGVLQNFLQPSDSSATFPSGSSAKQETSNSQRYRRRELEDEDLPLATTVFFRCNVIQILEKLLSNLYPGLLTVDFRPRLNSGFAIFSSEKTLERALKRGELTTLGHPIICLKKQKSEPRLKSNGRVKTNPYKKENAFVALPGQKILVALFQKYVSSSVFSIKDHIADTAIVMFDSRQMAQAAIDKKEFKILKFPVVAEQILTDPSSEWKKAVKQHFKDLRRRNTLSPSASKKNPATRKPKLPPKSDVQKKEEKLDRKRKISKLKRRRQQE